MRRLLNQVLAYTGNVIGENIPLGGACPDNEVRLLANLLLIV
jgi:hypothetical protein